MQGPLGYEPNTLTTAPLRSWFRLDGDSLNTSRSSKKRMACPEKMFRLGTTCTYLFDV